MFYIMYTHVKQIVCHFCSIMVHLQGWTSIQFSKILEETR